MAILGTDEDPNNPNAPSPGTAAAGGTGAAPAAGIGGTSGGGGFVGGGGGQGATTTAKGGGAPGGYTNLSSYLNANQGAGAQMAQGVENVLSSSGQAADKAAGTYQASGTAAAKAGTSNVDPAQVAAIQGGAQEVDPALMAHITGGVVQNEYMGPGSVNAGYTGPSSVAAPAYSGPSDAASMSGQAGGDREAYKTLQNTLTGQLTNANSGQSGISALLKGTSPTAGSTGSAGIYQQPGYTAGENSLDAFLTGGSGAYQQGLQGINNTWGGEAAKGAAADTAINGAIQAGKQTSTDTQNGYNGMIAAAQGKSNATQAVYNQAIKDAQAKAAAWKPPVGVMGTSADFAPAAAPAGTTPDGQGKGAGPLGAGDGGGTGQVAKALNQTSPGAVNHALATFGGPATQSFTQGNATGGGALGAGTPITNLPAQAAGGYQTLVKTLAPTAPTPSNLGKAAKKLGGFRA